MKRKTIKKIVLNILGAVLLLWAFNLAIPLPAPLFEHDYSTIITDRDGNILRGFLNSEQQWYFPPEPGLKLPGKLETAILMFEDRHFFDHPGVNPFSMARALGQFLVSGKVKSGGSTITMQVVRRACKNKRNLPNKILEMLQALKLERRYSKQEILRMYVHHAPYGGNIIGYHAASLKYFGKKPDTLTWSEAATLAVLPNSPGLISPTVNRDKLIKKGTDC